MEKQNFCSCCGRHCDLSSPKCEREQTEPLLAQREKRHEEMFSCLSEEDKKSLLRLLEKINKDWETRYQKMGKEHKHCDGHHKGHGHHGRGER